MGSLRFSAENATSRELATALPIQPHRRWSALYAAVADISVGLPRDFLTLAACCTAARCACSVTEHLRTHSSVAGPHSFPQTIAASREPSRDCPLCPRLVAFRQSIRARERSWFNAPVPSLGPADAPLLIVGLAPGLRGANRTGRPFTGDYAGDLL